MRAERVADYQKSGVMASLVGDLAKTQFQFSTEDDF
jgi:hypothetical protein